MRGNLSLLASARVSQVLDSLRYLDDVVQLDCQLDLKRGHILLMNDRCKWAGGHSYTHGKLMAKTGNGHRHQSLFRRRCRPVRPWLIHRWSTTTAKGRWKASPSFWRAAGQRAAPLQETTTTTWTQMWDHLHIFTISPPFLRPWFAGNVRLICMGKLHNELPCETVSKLYRRDTLFIRIVAVLAADMEFAF